MPETMPMPLPSEADEFTKTKKEIDSRLVMEPHELVPPDHFEEGEPTKERPPLTIENPPVTLRSAELAAQESGVRLKREVSPDEITTGFGRPHVKGDRNLPPFTPSIKEPPEEAERAA